MIESLSQSELSTLMASEKRRLAARAWNQRPLEVCVENMASVPVVLYFRKNSNGIYPTNILSTRTSVWESMAIQETEEVNLTPESQQHSRRKIQI